MQHPRGKLLGGCSAINVQILAFPSKEDLDDIGKLGIKGWDWETMEPYYRKFHRSRMPHAECHDDHHLSKAGTLHDLGPIKTSRPSPMDPLAGAWLKTAQSMQPTESEDVHSEYSIGAHAVPCAVAPETHERSHSGKAYIDLAAKRANFHLVTAAHVEKIIFEPRIKDSRSPETNVTSSPSPENDAVAIGVLISYKGKIRSIKARKEVILCGGSFGSPQLLELSGIGNKDLLDKFGIGAVVDNPNVGGKTQPFPLPFSPHHLKHVHARKPPRPHFRRPLPRSQARSEDIRPALPQPRRHERRPRRV